MAKRVCIPRFIIIALLALVLLSFQTIAFGVGTPFITNDTLKLEPLQKYVYVLTVQNSESIDFELNLTYEGQGIAVMRSRDFHIAPISFDNQFIFDIEIPSKDKPGKEYYLSWSARPIINNTGQVPVIVEIRRTLTIMVVDDEGMGYRETIFDLIWRPIAAFFSWLVSIWVFLLIPLVAACIYYLSKRFWKISKHVSERILQRANANIKQEPEPIMNEEADISSAKTIKELHVIISKMPSDVLKVREVKNIISLKLLELKKPKIAQKILSTETKVEILRLIK